MSDSAVNKNHEKKQDIAEDLGEYNPSRNLSTPTELLVEFLSTIMIKDYEMALKHCMEILKHEPNNTTALEFYPLIVEKLEMMKYEELDNTSSETSLSSSSISSSSSENIFNQNEFLNESRCQLRGKYLNQKNFKPVNGGVTSKSNVSKRASTTEDPTAVESSIPLLPKPKSNFVSLPKANLKMKIPGSVTPLPSNLLIHPTQTITLISKKSNISTRTCSRPKTGKRTPTTAKKKPSKLLLHTTPTIIFPKTLPPRNLSKSENPQ